MLTQTMTYIACAGATILCAAIVVPALQICLAPAAEITYDNYERIQHGMTDTEVEAIFGGPARDYTGGRCCLGICWFGMHNNPPGCVMKTWTGADPDGSGRALSAFVSFDVHGLVTDKSFLLGVIVERTPYERLRRWAWRAQAALGL